MRHPDPNHRVFILFTLGAIALMVGRIVSMHQVFSDVIDEPYHIGAGVGMYMSGRHAYGGQHPPLPRLVAALPLVLSGVDDPVARSNSEIQPDLTRLPSPRRG